MGSNERKTFKFLNILKLFLQVPNNYETDLIFPIIEKAAELASISYALTDDSSRTKLKVCYSLFKNHYYYLPNLLKNFVLNITTF